MGRGCCVCLPGLRGRAGDQPGAREGASHPRPVPPGHEEVPARSRRRQDPDHAVPGAGGSRSPRTRSSRPPPCASYSHRALTRPCFSSPFLQHKEEATRLRDTIRDEIAAAAKSRAQRRVMKARRQAQREVRAWQPREPCALAPD